MTKDLSLNLEEGKVEKSKTMESTIKSWQWLVKVAASKHFERLAAGILSGLLIIIAFLLLPVKRSERSRESDAIHLEIER